MDSFSSTCNEKKTFLGINIFHRRSTWKQNIFFESKPLFGICSCFPNHFGWFWVVISNTHLSGCCCCCNYGFFFQCDAECGQGNQTRHVTCVRSQRPSTTCDYGEKPAAWRTCTVTNCNEKGEPPRRGCTQERKNCLVPKHRKPEQGLKAARWEQELFLNLPEKS